MHSDTHGFDRAHADLIKSALLPRLFDAGYAAYRPALSGMWLRRPMVLCALCLFAGDLIGLSGQIPLMFWYIAASIAAVFASAMAALHRPRVWQLLICVLLVGGTLGAQVMTAPAAPPEGECYITGRVVSVVRSDEERIVLDIDQLTADGAAYGGKTRLTLYRPQDEDTPDMSLPDGFAIGAKVLLFGKTYMPQGARGEGGFDYRAYLMRRGVYSCASGKLAGAQFEPIGQLKLLNWFYDLRQSVTDALDAELGEQSLTARGIMLGDSASMPDELYDTFRDAGFSHILAVSGMHISAIIMLLGALMQIVPGKLRSAIIVIVLILYCGITGFSASVVRASIMGAVMLMTRQAGLRYDGPSALALAAAIILAITPGAALDTGFALTFGAVMAIYALYPGLRSHLPHIKIKPEHEPEQKLLRALSSGGVRFVNFAGEWLINSLALSVCVNAGLIPLTSAYFGRMNLLSLITSSVGIAAGMGVLCAGWATALLHGFAPHIARIAASIAKLCAQAIAGVAAWTAGLDFGVVYMRAIDSWWLLAFVPLLLWASRYRPLARTWRVVCAFAAALLVVVLLLPPLPGEGMDYVMVDVGQGDGTLFTDGANAIVIDVGEEDSALPDYIRRRGLRVNAVIVTHLHSDHAGALEELVQMSRIKQIYLPENAEHGADDEMLEALSRLKQSGVGLVYLRAGDEISTRGDLKLSVLHPDAARDFDNANDYSLVIRAEYAGRTILITGDLTEAGEDFDVSECDVLKVAHHGSAGSSSLDFLCAANPKLALISVAAHNSYGLPKQALLDRLNYIAAQVLTTAEGGDITVHISPDGEITASTYLNTQS